MQMMTVFVLMMIGITVLTYQYRRANNDTRAEIKIALEVGSTATVFFATIYCLVITTLYIVSLL